MNYLYESFVYKWTYIDGSYYIGIHKGHIHDGYTGSGTKFRKLWNTTIKNNWEREILFQGTHNECLTLERKLVNKTTLSDDKCLNVAIGGGGGTPGKRVPNTGNYRVLPQKIKFRNIIFYKRIDAIKHFDISFEELNMEGYQVL